MLARGAMLAVARRVVHMHHSSWRGLLVAIITPLCMLLFLGPSLGTMLGTSIEYHGRAIDYMTYFVPGISALTAFYASLFGSGNVIVLDKMNGLTDVMRTTPARTRAVVFGHVLGGAALGWIQGAAFLAVGFLFTPSFTVSAGSLAGLPLLAGCTLFFSNAGFVLGNRLSMTNFSMVSTILSVPLVYSSTVFVPSGAFPGWLSVLVEMNPVSVTAELARMMLTGTFSFSRAGPGLAVSLVFVLLLVMAMIEHDSFPQHEKSREKVRGCNQVVPGGDASRDKLDTIEHVFDNQRLQSWLPLLAEGRVDEVLASMTSDEIASVKRVVQGLARP